MRFNHFIAVIIIALASQLFMIDLSFGQQSTDSTAKQMPQLQDKGDKIFDRVEEMPEFTGGDESRIIFLANNIKYPQQARQKRISGTVYVTFVVEKDGSLSNPKILRGIGEGCDEEVIRVVKLMPRWQPGKQQGEAVRVQFNMPVKFVLAN